MEWVFENPWPGVIMGGLLVVALTGGFIQTGRKWLAGAAGVVLLLTVIYWGVEQVVVTEQEAVTDTLYALCDAVESDDLQQVLSLIAKQAPGVARQAKSEFPRYRIDQIDVKRNLKISFSGEGAQRQAKAEFNVTVTGTEKSGAIGHFHAPRFVVLTFVKEEGQWRLLSYAHDKPKL